ncbi:tyrosine-protein phosphatase [Paenibacillus solisilvae]|uniref:Tyrosine-protein phosphatase n=1 Tax=Paenibacillus solisilvae TaxID=2486751 RepID=A0ABW0VVD2_9BACL
MIIDIHSHILPTLDDGPSSREDSIEMAKRACKEGIHHMIATPHHANGKYVNEALAVENAVSELNHYLETCGIDLTLYPGQEIRVYDGLLDDLNRGDLLLSLNYSRYLLLEFPTTHIPKYSHSLFYELRLMDLVPIIAHPERNLEVMDDPEKLIPFIELGALGQVTSHSLQGLFGKKIQKVALDLCQRNYAHLMASDAHDNQRRTPELQLAYYYLQKQTSDSHADYFQTNAHCVLHSNPVEIWEPKSMKKKWFWF